VLIKKLIKTYSPFSTAIIKQNYLAYRSRFLLWTIANTITLLVQVFLWIAIFNNSPTETINGYSKQMMINYVIISKIIESITFVSIEQQVARDLQSGSIVNSFTKPINYEIEVLFKALGGIIGSTIIFAPIYCLILIIFNADGEIVISNFNIIIMLFFILHLIISFVLNFLVSLIFSSILFKTIKHGGVYEIKKILIMFLSGALFPINFYPLFLSKVLEYTPFIYIRYVPINILFGKMTINEMLLSSLIGLAWCIIVYVFAFSLWKRMIKYITIFGG